MRSPFLTATILSLIPYTLGNPTTLHCKTAPSAIPASSWSYLNSTVSGALLSTAAIGVPGGICHPEQPNYNASLCPELQEAWFKSWDPIITHPVHNAMQNWNNDSCWPFPELGLQCHPLIGYPTYVVNATTPEQVSATIDFARQNNVRLIVKSSGHDFRARSVAGNSLSIWVHNMLGLEVHESFTPSCDCDSGDGETAITWAAGENAFSKFTFAHQNGLMLNVGGGPTTSTGYAIGGGHSIISPTHGLAADNILEVNIVTPDGELVTANACQNEDLFWAIRGGGGSTFGVVINITERAFPEASMSWVGVQLAGIVPSNATADVFYNATASFLNHFPDLGDAGLMAYSEIRPGNVTTTPIFAVEFLGVDQSLNQTEALLEPILTQLNATYLPQGYVILTNMTSYSKIYDYWIQNLDDNGSVTPIGVDEILASRLLDKPALTNPNLGPLLKVATGQVAASLFLVAGPGVHRLPGDFDAVHPIWRRSYIHTILGAGWLYGNQTAATFNTEDLDARDAALRQIAPNEGSYLNEANPYELNFQHTFWGSNYPRLLQIKRDVDPHNVFWCKSCVGSEGIDVVNNLLCRL